MPMFLDALAAGVHHPHGLGPLKGPELHLEPMEPLFPPFTHASASIHATAEA
jgi:hypothetical protein